jgi:hypothetical protein
MRDILYPTRVTSIQKDLQTYFRDQTLGTFFIELNFGRRDKVFPTNMDGFKHVALTAVCMITEFFAGELLSFLQPNKLFSAAKYREMKNSMEIPWGKRGVTHNPNILLSVGIPMPHAS